METYLHHLDHLETHQTHLDHLKNHWRFAASLVASDFAFNTFVSQVSQLAKFDFRFDHPSHFMSEEASTRGGQHPYI